MKYHFSLKTHQAFSFLMFFVLFSSCARLPVYKSENPGSSSENAFAQISAYKFDKKSNVRYAFANNDKNFYFKAIFIEQESFIKIMRGGLIIYFDPNGKKSKEYALKIERGENQAMNKAMFSQQSISSLDNRRNAMPAMLNAALNKITWEADGKESVFYRGFHEHEIVVEIKSTEANELELNVRIPMEKLPIPESQIMSIGIVTGSFSSGSGSRAQNGMRSGGGRGSGGRGGGMRGGGGAGRGGGRQMGASGGGSSTNMSPVQIWFQVDFDDVN